MADFQHITLPLGSSRLSLVQQIFKRWFSERSDQKSDCLYLCHSNLQLSSLQQGLLQKFPALPPGYWGKIESLSRSLKEYLILNDKLSPSAFLTPGYEHFLLRSLGARLEKRFRFRFSNIIQEAEDALRLFCLSFPPHDRLLVLQEYERYSEEPFRTRCRFLQALLELFHNETAVQKQKSSGDLEWVLAEHAQTICSAFPLLILDRPRHFYPAQRKLIAALAKYAERVCVLNFEGEADHSLKTFFGPEYPPETFGYKLGEKELSPERIAVIRGLSQWQEHQKKSDCAQKDFEKSGIEVKVLATPRQEARYVIKHIIEHMQIPGFEPSRVGVCFMNKEQMDRGRVEFESAGIPVSSTTYTRLFQLPPIACLQKLLQVCLGSPGVEKLFTALNSPFLQGFRDKSHDLSWEVFLSSFKRLTKKYSLPKDNSLAQGIGKAWILPIQEILDENQEEHHISSSERSVLEQALVCLAQLEGLCQANTMEELLQKLLSLLEKLRMPEIMKKLEGDFIALSSKETVATNLRGYRLFLDVLYELLSFHQKKKERKYDQKKSFEELYHEFDECVFSAPFYQEHKQETVVFCQPSELENADFDCLFICGLVEGDYPLLERKNPFFVKGNKQLTRKKEWHEATRLLFDTSDPFQLYRHFLTSALASGKHKVCLLMPLGSNDSESENIASLPLQELLASCGIDWQDLYPKVDAEQKESQTKAILSLGDLQEDFVQRFKLQEVHQETRALSCNDALALELPWLVLTRAALKTNLARNAWSFKLSPYEGYLSEQAAQVSQTHLLKGREVPLFSASMLDTYAQCPQRFFFRYVLGVEEREDVREEIPALERGAFLHQVFEHFFQEVRALLKDQKGAYHLHIPGTLEGPEQKERSFPLLDLRLYEEIQERKAAHLLQDVFARLVKEVNLGSVSWKRWCQRAYESLETGQRVVSELSAFLHFEFALQAQGVYPWLLEYDFGQGQAASALPFHDEKGQAIVEFRGSIDRIDAVVRAGVVQELLIRDYKSGNTTPARKLKKGLAFQLPLYGYVVQESFSDLELGGFFYHKLKEFQKFGIEAPYIHDQTFQLFKQAELGVQGIRNASPGAFLEQVLPVWLRDVLEAIARGRFHPPLVDPQQACNFCGYWMGCGVRLQKQLALKKREELLQERFQLYTPKKNFMNDQKEHGPLGDSNQK